MDAFIQSQLIDIKMKHDKWTYHWWERPIKQIFFSLQDWHDRMKLFSENHTQEHELPTVYIFMSF